MDLTKCDEDGVPKLVQKIDWFFSDMRVRIHYAGGGVVICNSEFFLPNHDILKKKLTDEEWIDLTTEAEKFIKDNWTGIAR